MSRGEAYNVRFGVRRRDTGNYTNDTSMIEIDKLRRWTNSETADRGKARDTHNEIRAALEMKGLRGVDENHDFKARLQGSYRNTTMVYGSGDVDILIIRTDEYHGDFSNASADPRSFAPAHNPKKTFEEHKEGVYRALQAEYGANNVEVNDKAIEVDGNGLPLGADVVPCIQFRKYWSDQPGNHMKGIVFWTANDEKIVNFPKRHRKEGVDINDRTGGNYKPTVRIFKNFRNTLDDDGAISKVDVPSYFVECLLSNVSEQQISKDDLRERIEGLLDELQEQGEDGFQEFTVQHGMQPLFGDETTQWDVGKARDFVSECDRYYHGGQV